MAVTAGSQGRVPGLASRVALGGDAGPVVDGVAQSAVDGLPHQHDAALAGALGDGGDAGQAAQGLIVSSLQGFGRFCEQRGEDDPPDWTPRISGSSRRAAHRSAPARLRFRQAPSSAGRARCRLP